MPDWNLILLLTGTGLLALGGLMTLIDRRRQERLEGEADLLPDRRSR